MDFTGARDDGVAVASAGPYTNHLHLAPDRSPRQYLTHSVFTGQMPFLPLNQQRQSTKGITIQTDLNTVARDACAL